MGNIFDELTRYRVKVDREGREIVNIPGILALPGLLIAPKMSIIGMVAAPLLGCNIHLEDGDGNAVDVGKKVQEAAETIVDTAKTAVTTFREEMDKAWESVSADDPADETEDAENPENVEIREDASDEETADDVAENTDTVSVKPDDTEKPE